MSTWRCEVHHTNSGDWSVTARRTGTTRTISRGIFSTFKGAVQEASTLAAALDHTYRIGVFS